jgi:hypothetical protein
VAGGLIGHHIVHEPDRMAEWPARPRYFYLIVLSYHEKVSSPPVSMINPPHMASLTRLAG